MTVGSWISLPSIGAERGTRLRKLWAGCKIVPGCSIFHQQRFASSLATKAAVAQKISSSVRFSLYFDAREPRESEFLLSIGWVRLREWAGRCKPFYSENRP